MGGSPGGGGRGGLAKGGWGGVTTGTLVSLLRFAAQDAMQNAPLVPADTGCPAASTKEGRGEGLTAK